ncbi:hypothetical protein WR25_10199 [Diploscapter pachys]|uniref:Uncharacterized protein n=1 Tax=Diploscapter pachys TaxID=2018661 RepID=A0A2A2KC02_9BILA|nr:hypothetical protein WR25_10199 [Diploscapter pachys]
MHGGLGQHRKQLVARAGHVAFDAHPQAVEPLSPGIGAGGLLQQRQAGNALGVEAGLPFQQGRAAHRHGVLAHQSVGLGARPVGVAEVNGGIEGRVGKQEGAGAVGQFDHIGALLAHHRKRVALHRIQLCGYLAAIGEPGFGHFHAPARTAEQFDIEEGLQAADLPTDGTLGQGQFLSGLGEALVTCGRLEADQGSGAGNLAAHVREPHMSGVEQGILMITK